MRFEEFGYGFFEDYRKIINDCSFLSVFGSEYCYSVMCALKDYQKLQGALTENGLIIKGEYKGKVFFGPPICRDEKGFVAAIEEIIAYCRDNGIEPGVKCLTEEMYRLVKDDERYQFVEVRDLAEYFYNVEDLISLSGKKYHSKRNFINTFNRLYEYRFVPYRPEFLEKIDNLIQIWQDNKAEYSEYERDAILFTLNNIGTCGNVYCDVLFVGDDLAGFIVGSVNKHLDVNIIYEKGNIEYKGIYPVLLNSFLKEHFEHCRYVNMQEDMGLEGLRKAKLSYHPTMLLKKYHLSLKQS